MDNTNTKIIIDKILKNRNELMSIFELFKKGSFNEESKLRLHYFIKNFSKGTDKQKNRFMLYYNLMCGSTRSYSYVEIAKYNNCSPMAIRGSVISFFNYLMGSQSEEEKKEFYRIINTIRYKNGRKFNFKRFNTFFYS